MPSRESSWLQTAAVVVTLLALALTGAAAVDSKIDNVMATSDERHVIRLQAAAQIRLETTIALLGVAKRVDALELRNELSGFTARDHAHWIDRLREVADHPVPGGGRRGTQ